MSSKKRLLIIFLIGFILACIFTVIILCIVKNNYNEMKQIQFTSMTAEELVRGSDYGSLILSSSERKSEITSGVKGKAGNYDYDYYFFSFGEFLGIHNMMSTNVESNQTVQFTCSSTIEGGKIKIYVISPDNKILEFFEVNSIDTFTVKGSDLPGTYLIKAAADSAKGKIELFRTFL